MYNRVFLKHRKFSSSTTNYDTIYRKISDSYSKSEINEMFNNINQYGTNSIDLSNYYTKTEVDDIINTSSETTLCENKSIILSPKRLNAETNDSPAIERCINKLINLGGGTLFIDGILEINNPININNNYISIKGNGENSVIKVISQMDYAIKIFYSNIYGNRGLDFRNFFIDCNNLARDGILVGSINPVVESSFYNIKIKNSIQWGMIVDSTQNSLFSLVDIENCGGNLKLINGAGNNVFLKCELANATKLDNILLDIDSSYSGYNSNLFSRIPQNNNFINCVTEGGSRKNCININYGIYNNFIKHEFESTECTNSCINFGTNSQYNSITGRIAMGYNEVLHIINNGFMNKIYDMYLENFSNNIFAKTSNRLILQNVTGNKTLNIENTAGDIAFNILKDSNSIYSYDLSEQTYPGQFLFNENELKFNSKETLVNINTLFYNNKINETITSNNISKKILLPEKGHYELYCECTNSIDSSQIYKTFRVVYTANIAKLIPDISINDDNTSDFTIIFNSNGVISINLSFTEKQTINLLIIIKGIEKLI